MFNFDKASTGAAGTSGAAAALGGLNLLSNAKQLKQLGQLNKSSSDSEGGASSGGAGATGSTGKKPSFNYNNVANSLGEGNGSNNNLDNTMPLNSENGRLGEVDSRLNEIDNNGGRGSLEDPNATYSDMYMNGNNYMETEYDRLQNERAGIIADQQRREQESLARGTNNAGEPSMLGRALGVGKRVGKALFGNEARNARAGKIVKGAVGKIATGVGAATGATAGLALGLATGDISKAASMAVGGAVAGGGAYRWIPSKIGKGAKAAMEEARYLANPTKAAEKDAQRKKKKERHAYMADHKNYKSATKMANELGIKGRNNISELQGQMYDLSKYGVTDFDEQKKALDMVNKHGSEGLDVMSAASLVHESNKSDYTKEKRRQEKYNSWVEENAQTMGVEKAQRVAQQRMDWQTEYNGGAKGKYSYTGNNENIRSQIEGNQRQNGR